MTDALSSRPGKAPVQWRSIEDLRGAAELDALSERESPNGRIAQVREDEGKSAVDAGRSQSAFDVSRRGFMGFAGATLATAASALGGCIRKPVEHIVPLSRRPEDMVPGKPIYYATAAQFGGHVLGLLVESQDGRPTKIEGNPKHPASLGKSHAWAQAAILGLYDNDRSRAPRKAGAPATWADWDAFAAEHFGALRGSGGAKLALLLQDSRSPTLQRLVSEFRAAFPQAGVFVHDPSSPANGRAGLELVGQTGMTALPDLSRAQLIAAVDCDFLGTEGEIVRNSMQFADGRRLATPDGASMNRLYSVEARLSTTGMMADNRLRLASSRAGAFLAAVAAKLLDAGLTLPPVAADLAALLSTGSLDEKASKFAAAVATDLLQHRGRGLVLVGERQPAAVHALGHLVNALLENVGSTVSLAPAHAIPSAGSLAELLAAAGEGKFETLLILGGNPAYDGGAGAAAGLAKAGTLVHVSPYVDETSSAAAWHLPESQFLESWGDLRSLDGTISVQQPLIAPLFGTRSALEILLGVLGSKESAHDAVRATWSPPSDVEWRRWLHDGLVPGSASPRVAPALVAAPTLEMLFQESEPPGRGGLGPVPVPGAFDWSRLTAAWQALPAAEVSASSMEIDLILDSKVLDGRWANNAWLQEAPEATTKLTWDNAAQLSPATARRLGLWTQDMVSISAAGGGTLTAPVWVAPGLADDVVVLPLGYGRSAGGSVLAGSGFDGFSLRNANLHWFAAGASVAKAEGQYELASTQNHDRAESWRSNGGDRLEARPGMPPRPIIREASFATWKDEPAFVEKSEMLPESRLHSLWVHPNVTGGQQWGMSVDLTTCTGCATCVVACIAENNIQVVGKLEMLRGREMHWIRVDRYFTGSEDDPQAVVQPMLCLQCETAPCESVCPVAATSHSPEGLNDMAYNRCIGTRYCANNCPVKIRRFNFFNYSKRAEEANPLLQLQRNPDVSVRFRGVMEKCTYCVQRINAAKIEAKREGDGVVPDGRIVPACVQACPSEALVFGDIRDPESRVSKSKARAHEYAILAELNLHARTTYVAKIRNPNPDLA